MKKREPDEPSEQDRPAPKQPYERPAVVSEEVFETLALSCGPEGFSCQFNPQS